MTKVHKQAVRFADNDFDMLLIGHDGHEEVEGTQGHAPDRIQIVNASEDVDRLIRDLTEWRGFHRPRCQLTTMEVVHLLRERFPNLVDPPSDNICYATQNRQVAVKKMAPLSDVVITVGSANSSNSVRLMEVALDAGAGASYRWTTPMSYSLNGSGSHNDW